MSAYLNKGIPKRLSLRQFPAVFVLKILLVGVILISFGVAVLRYQHTVSVGLEYKNSQRQEDNTRGGLLKEVKPLSFYQDLLQQRDVFHFQSAIIEPVKEIGEFASAASSNFALRYVVQGIVIDQNSEAIIKDTQSAKTHFIHLNEKLDGATLIDIQSNRLIFNLDGKKFELIKK